MLAILNEDRDKETAELTVSTKVTLFKKEIEKQDYKPLFSAVNVVDCERYGVRPGFIPPMAVERDSGVLFRAVIFIPIFV